MQYKNKSFFTVAASAALASTAMAAYVPSEPWTALTPTATYSDAVTDYTSSFGIAVNPITVSTSASSAKVTSSAAGKNKKRDAVSQIGDGQIQATTATKSTAAPVSQISDGQVQATTATKSTAAPVSQISDGQAQATTATKSSATAASQVSDGQIQATTGSSTSTSAGATSSSKSTEQKDDEFVKAQSCQSSGTLSMTLKDGVLTDNKGRIGSIVANRQFQFDGPPPQAGAIYAKGWGITPEGNLAIGDEDVFYQCLSGDFYNLYDEHIGDQCTPIHLEVIELINC